MTRRIGSLRLRAAILIGVSVLGVVPESRGAEHLTWNVPADPQGEVSVAALLAGLAHRAAVPLDVGPAGPAKLPVVGIPGNLTLQLLRRALGAGVYLDRSDRGLQVRLDPAAIAARRAELRGALDALVDTIGSLRRARDEVARRYFGLHPRCSYRPNDPERPTICLIHGLNAGPGVFNNLIGPLESQGFGIVLDAYDYDAPIAQSARRFAARLAALRAESGDRQPWTLITHSMGGLVARAYVEDDRLFRHDVRRLILIGPPNHGSHLAPGQQILLLSERQRADASPAQAIAGLARMTTELSPASRDLTPGSAFLRALNRRPRRAGVSYDIIAGDRAYVPAPARATPSDVTAQLGRLIRAGIGSEADEFIEGKGDGVVSVASTRLAGVDDWVLLHAGHLALVGAPRVSHPGDRPICLGQVLAWLGAGTDGHAWTGIDPDRGRRRSD